MSTKKTKMLKWFNVDDIWNNFAWEKNKNIGFFFFQNVYERVFRNKNIIDVFSDHVFRYFSILFYFPLNRFTWKPIVLADYVL